MDGEDNGMRDWNQILAGADEDYLIGLSNKGTVKRAHKDMESVQAQIVDMGDEAQVMVGEATVTIRCPLPESGCSCPSVSICRHVIQAILVLQKQLTAGDRQAKAEQGMPDRAAGTGDAENAGSPGHEALWQEIREFPMQKARRVMGSRAFRQFAAQIRLGATPQIRETSVIMLTLPAGGATVKLLSPLSYSSCTCHKKELCSHKAEAILWCQYQAGVFTRHDIEEEETQQPDFDLCAVREAGEKMKYILESLLDTGLARAAEDILQDMERMAVISHNVGLARMEGAYRALADMCGRYFRRAASFRLAEFLQRLTDLYLDVCKIMAAESAKEIAPFAGAFRAQYREVGELHLTGITMEQFASASGYAGETIYFLEETEGKWYTYTNARPVFYEGTQKRRGGAYSQMPWELNGALSELAASRLCLKGAKADARRRLSSSAETKGERMGVRILTEELLKNWYYEDFLSLFQERIPVCDTKKEDGWEQEPQSGEPVFIRPADMGQAAFSDTEQVFSLPLLDERGREVIVEVAYSKRESETIRYLERFVSRWQQAACAEKSVTDKERLPCFLGRIYLHKGRIRMYPLALFAEKELPALANTEKEVCESGREWDSESIAMVKMVTQEASSLMEEICQSGLNTVHDSTLEAMDRLRDAAESFGLSGLSRQLAGLREGIDMRRHQTVRTEDEMAALYGKINQYLILCRQRIMWDEANEYYRGGNEL